MKKIDAWKIISLGLRFLGVNDYKIIYNLSILNIPIKQNICKKIVNFSKYY
jgi:hypothetical protein